MARFTADFQFAAPLETAKNLSFHPITGFAGESTFLPPVGASAERLAPDQVRVTTLNDGAALIDYAQPIVNELRANLVRVDADFSATPFKAKISNAEQLRVTMLVIGGRDMESGAVSIHRPPRRPTRREAEGGSGGGYSGEY